MAFDFSAYKNFFNNHAVNGSIDAAYGGPMGIYTGPSQQSLAAGHYGDNALTQQDISNRYLPERLKASNYDSSGWNAPQNYDFGGLSQNVENAKMGGNGISPSIKNSNGYIEPKTLSLNDPANQTTIQNLLNKGLNYENDGQGNIKFYADAPTFNAAGLQTDGFSAPSNGDNWLDKNIGWVGPALVGGAALAGLGATGGAASGADGIIGTTGQGGITAGNAAGISDGMSLANISAAGAEAGAGAGAGAGGSTLGGLSANGLAGSGWTGAITGAAPGAAPGLTLGQIAAGVGGLGAAASGLNYENSFDTMNASSDLGNYANGLNGAIGASAGAPLSPGAYDISGGLFTGGSQAFSSFSPSLLSSLFQGGVGANGSSLANLLLSGITGATSSNNAGNLAAANKGIADQIGNTYDLGGDYANYLHETLARQDAAAGRNSQYGPRESDFLAKLAGSKLQALTSPAYTNAVTGATTAQNTANNSYLPALVAGANYIGANSTMLENGLSSLGNGVANLGKSALSYFGF